MYPSKRINLEPLTEERRKQLVDKGIRKLIEEGAIKTKQQEESYRRSLNALLDFEEEKRIETLRMREYHEKYWN